MQTAGRGICELIKATTEVPLSRLAANAAVNALLSGNLGSQQSQGRGYSGQLPGFFGFGGF